MSTVQIEVTDEFDKWLKALRDLQAKVRIFERIRRLGDGNPGDVKPVGKGVSEMRINYGPGYRLYYTQRSGSLIILLCGGDKSSQTKDIARAIALAQRSNR
ncbi:MAG: type II toxin-antitoxin system RelE/ParE family toxin [Xanthobacteraceae bacterium]|nr:type II toxin-antitoxin system RelE/ParE family toxin [Xanthobacteraceae bacterium]